MQLICYKHPPLFPKTYPRTIINKRKLCTRQSTQRSRRRSRSRSCCQRTWHRFETVSVLMSPAKRFSTWPGSTSSLPGRFCKTWNRMNHNGPLRFHSQPGTSLKISLRLICISPKRSVWNQSKVPAHVVSICAVPTEMQDSPRHSSVFRLL